MHRCASNQNRSFLADHVIGRVQKEAREFAADLFEPRFSTVTFTNRVEQIEAFAEATSDDLLNRITELGRGFVPFVAWNARARISWVPRRTWSGWQVRSRRPKARKWRKVLPSVSISRSSTAKPASCNGVAARGGPGITPAISRGGS